MEQRLRQATGAPDLFGQTDVITKHQLEVRTYLCAVCRGCTYVCAHYMYGNYVHTYVCTVDVHTYVCCTYAHTIYMGTTYVCVVDVYMYVRMFDVHTYICTHHVYGNYICMCSVCIHEYYCIQWKL